MIEEDAEWQPPLPDGWSIEDVFAGEPSPNPSTWALVSGPDAELVADIWSSDAREAREAALRYRAVEALARRRPASLDRPPGTPGSAGRDSRALVAPRLAEVSESFVPELALIRCCTENEAARLALEAVALVRHLPATLVELEAGRCSVRKAQAMIDLLSPVSAEVAARIEAAVVPDLEARTVPQLRGKIRRLLAKWDADALEARRQEAKRRVDVTHQPVGDGMSQLLIGLPTPVAAACADACDQYAQALRTGGDLRPIGQLRTQVAADLILRPWDTTRPPVTANLTIHAPMACIPAEGCDSAAEPAEVAGHVVTAAQCAELLAQLDAIGLRAPAGGSLSVAVEDRDTGRLVAVANRRELERAAYGTRTRRRRTNARKAGRHRTAPRRNRGGQMPSTGGVPTGPGLRPPPLTSAYRPTAAQRRFLQVRDCTCRMPGCNRRAGRCDIDHDRPWGAGGETDVCNLACLCRRHHRIKTHIPGWAFQLLPDGRLRVRTPSGVVRTSWPPGISRLTEPDAPEWEEQAPPDPLRDRAAGDQS